MKVGSEHTLPPTACVARAFRQYALLAVVFSLVFTADGVVRASDYPNRPITIICPWAAGGGTDRVSRRMAFELERKLQVPVNVINATGGKGVTGHNRGLKSRPDGYTLTMMTFELNTMHWMRLTDLTYKDALPLVSVNEDYAALLVAADSPWQSVSDVAAAIKAAQEPLTASGTAAGGAWHLALAGWLDSADLPAEKVVWIPSAGSSPSLQQLVSGGVDMVCCSLPEARSLLEAGTVRALGVMSPERAVGFEQVLTFGDQGDSWTLGGWRGLGLPLGTPPEVVAKLRDTLEAIVSAPASQPDSFAAFMQQQKFDSTWRDAEEFEQFMADGDAKLGKILQSEALAAVSEDRFNPMLYPSLLFGIGLISAGWCFVSRAAPTEIPAATADASAGDVAIQSTRPWNAILCIASIALFALVAEQVGFVIVSIALLAALQILLGTRPPLAILVAVILGPAVYLLFAKALRVGLPMGWFGW
ncbi:MAG TPA: hypothetical protein DDW52_26950 [Planctomycetaceae bacterium]|nr:hypothetical protein [Planctomycetaceae bacterium]